MNSINISGRLTQDPEFAAYKKRTGEDAELAKLRVAVNRPGTYGDKKKTDFFNVVSYQSAAFCKHLAKGREVSVTGVMTYTEYEKKDGSGKNARYEIIADNVEAHGSGEGSQAVVAEVQVPSDKQSAAPTQKKVSYEDEASGIY